MRIFAPPFLQTFWQHSSWMQTVAFVCFALQHLVRLFLSHRMILLSDGPDQTFFYADGMLFSLPLFSRSSLCSFSPARMFFPAFAMTKVVRQRSKHNRSSLLRWIVRNPLGESITFWHYAFADTFIASFHLLSTSSQCTIFQKAAM